MIKAGGRKITINIAEGNVPGTYVAISNGNERLYYVHGQQD